MKKIKSLSLMLAIIVIAASGCLKDKGFENHEYGINDADNSPAGVGFHLGIRYRNAAGLDLSSTPQTIENVVIVSLLSGQVATSDVRVKLQVDPTIITRYNTANGTSLEVLSPSLYSFGSVDLVIPKGEKQAKVVITVPSTNTLDPGKIYGVGLKIASVDGGYTIASNMDEILVSIGLKNKYDGVYTLRGYHNRDPYTFPYQTTMHMVTTTGNSNAFFWPEVDDYGHPIGTAPGQTNWYGPTIAPVVVFDLSTNLVTNVYNAGGSTPITMFTGAGAGVSRYDPATKTIYVSWNYNGNPLRAFFDTLVYQRAR
jgi:hypothetical protein